MIRPNIFRRLASKFYFSRYRNLLTGWQLIYAALIFAILFLLIASRLSIQFPVLRTKWVSVPAVFLSVLGVVYFALGYLCSYNNSAMMLRADGANRWSIHMGGLVSVSSWLYARTPNDFIRAGTLAILKAAGYHQLVGVIEIRSHLIGKDTKRTKYVARLQKTLGDAYEVADRGLGAPLNCFEAWMLSRAQRAHRNYRNNEPTKDFSRGAPVGIIEVSLKENGTAPFYDEISKQLAARGG